MLSINTQPSDTYTLDTLHDATETHPSLILRQADRCDRCGAQAFFIAKKNNGLDLLFCGHHGHKFSGSLIIQGFIVHDQTYRINESVSS